MMLETLPSYARQLPEIFGQARVAEALAIMRPPSEVMVKESLRLMKASPLSFTRSLIDRMRSEAWVIERSHCEVAADGAGLVIYRIRVGQRELTFATYCAGLAPVERSGRIMDEAMDYYSALFDGPVGMDRILAEADRQVKKIWKGRSNNEILGWTFANRSNRLFDYVVSSLEAGAQPDLGRISEGGGYMIRNAGFYGNGRHGSRSWAALPADHPLSYPYHVDLFCLYLWRLVGFDFAEGMARARGASGTTLSDEVRRHVGVGNSSGIGMVAALVRWPHWVSGFGFAREFALAMALSEQGPPDPARLDRLAQLLGRAARYYLETGTEIDPSVEDRGRISSEMLAARTLLETWRRDGQSTVSTAAYPMRGLMIAFRERFSRAACEQIVSLIIETRPDLVKPVREVIPAAMASRRDVVPEMRLLQLKAVIERVYDWALDIDFSRPGAAHYFWYRSEENGENRRGERAVDPGLAFETLVNVAGHIQSLHARIGQLPGDWTVARYLVDYPDDVYFVARVQLLGELPYGEVQSNLIDQSFRPSDLIQYYLSVLGMETTNPGNFRWVRGVFMQGAPLPDDILRGTHQDWVLPASTNDEQPALHSKAGETV